MSTSSIQKSCLCRRKDLTWTRLLILGIILIHALAIPLRAYHKIDAAPKGVIENGIPPFSIFSSDSLGLQTPPFDLKELPDGRILIVGATELVVGDGVRWELIHRSPTESRYLSGQVSIDEKGQIWTSLYEGFCRVLFDEKGQWYFDKPVPLPDHHNRQWPALLLTRKINSQDYWFGNALISWSPDARQQPRILHSNISAQHIFQLGNRLYAANPNTGNILIVEPDGGVSTVFDKDHNDPASSIESSTPLDEKNMLVGTSSNGICVFDGKELRKFVFDHPLSSSSRISDLCRTRDGTFAAAVDSQGIVFFNSEGRTLQVLGKNVDHRFGQIRRLLRGSDGNLWALFTRGVVRIEYPSLISYIDPMLEFGADFVFPVRHQGKLWLLVTGKVMRGDYQDNRLGAFKTDTPPSNFAYTLASCDGRLFAGCTDGLYERTTEGWRIHTRTIHNARLVLKSPQTGKWLYVARGELGWMDLSQETPGVERIPTRELEETYNAAVTQSGEVWLELGVGKIGRIRIESDRVNLRVYTRDDGLAGGWAEIFVIDETVRTNCSGRTMRFEPELDRFVLDDTLSVRYPELKGTIGGRPSRDAAGRIWIPDTDMVRIVDDTRGPDARRVEVLPAELKPGTFVCSDDGVVWMQERLRFARYDPGIMKPSPAIPKAIITRIEQPSTGRTLMSPTDEIPDMTREQSTLIAHFAASKVPYGERVTFEIRIDGTSDQWTPAGVSGSAMINTPKEGTYTLRVRPKMSWGTGVECAVRFTILPPWYRTPTALSLFGIGACVLIAAAIVIPLYAERIQKVKLEQLVTRRTKDLSASEERYRELNGELEQRVRDRTSALDHTADQLRAANQELESFSYSVSHDLRAPLRNITGFIELIDKQLREDRGSDVSHQMSIVISEAKRLATLIEDLLLFSRLSRAELKTEEIDLTALVNDSRRELAHEMEGRSIEWIIGPLPHVLGDKALIRQVWANLLGNAVKFTKNRSPAIITVTADKTPGTDGYLFIHVADNGAGFNPKYAAKLFGVFQRLHSGKDFEGTGIGLANVKRIVSRHGGQVHAEGKPNLGAVFSFSLRPSAMAAPPHRAPPDKTQVQA